MAQFDLQWTAPEFTRRDRDVSWYWISIIVAAAMIAFAVWQRDFLFGFFIVIAEMLAIVWASRTPRAISFSLSEHDLVIDERKHYAMNSFESFSQSDASEDDAELIFHPKGRLQTSVVITIPREALETAVKNLKLILREVEYQPSLIDSLEKLIGF